MLLKGKVMFRSKTRPQNVFQILFILQNILGLKADYIKKEKCQTEGGGGGRKNAQICVKYYSNGPLWTDLKEKLHKDASAALNGACML